MHFDIRTAMLLISSKIWPCFKHGVFIHAGHLFSHLCDVPGERTEIQIYVYVRLVLKSILGAQSSRAKLHDFPNDLRIANFKCFIIFLN